MALEEFENLRDLEDFDAESPEHRKRAIIFDLACARYGFLLRDIITVFEPDQITPLPNPPQCIIGLTNYRNETVPVIDFRSKISTAKPTYSPNNRLIKVQFRDMSLALFIEKIGEPVQYGKEDIVDSSEIEAGDIPARWILELINVHDEKVLILDIPALLEELYDEIHHKSPGG